MSKLVIICVEAIKILNDTLSHDEPYQPRNYLAFLPTSTKLLIFSCYMFRYEFLHLNISLHICTKFILKSIEGTFW